MNHHQLTIHVPISIDPGSCPTLGPRSAGEISGTLAALCDGAIHQVTATGEAAEMGARLAGEGLMRYGWRMVTGDLG